MTLWNDFWNFYQHLVGVNYTQFQAILPAVLTTLLILYIWQNYQRTKHLPPGPIGLPIVGFMPFLGKEPHKTLLELCKKYRSNIISLRLGSRYTVVLNDYDLMKEAFSHPALQNRPPNIFDAIGNVGFGDKNGEVWLDQRRFCVNAAKDLGLGRGAWENHIQEEIQEFTDDLVQANGKPMEVAEILKNALLKNVLSLLIGRRLKRGEEDEKIKLLADYTDVALSYVGPSDPVSLMPGLKKIVEFFKIGGYYKVANTVQKFHELLDEELEMHKRTADSSAVDFVNMYRAKMEEELSKGSKTFFSESLLHGNVTSLFIGGSDTIYSSLEWLFHLMAEYPEIQKKVQEELDDVLGKDGSASYYERSRIPFTFAVMMESQRYSSIVPISPNRCASSDFVLRGYTIPKGTEMITNIWTLHHDPKYWNESEKFIPERFLDDSGKLTKTPPSFVPFSVGRRNCPGETVAWMEILAFFTSVVRRFTITPPPGKKLKHEISYGLVTHLKSKPLCFIERKS